MRRGLIARWRGIVTSPRSLRNSWGRLAVASLAICMKSSKSIYFFLRGPKTRFTLLFLIVEFFVSFDNFFWDFAGFVLFCLLPGGTPLYKPYRYVPPHRVGFSAVLVWKRVYTGYTLCPFWSGIGFGFRGNYESVWTYLLFQFQMSEKEREICEFETDLNNVFVCALI